MKKIIIAISVVVIFLAIFLPLASSNPDGLEKVAITYGAKDSGNIWNGLISLQSLGNSYVSSLIAGVFGAAMVLIAGLVLTKVMKQKV